MIPSSKYLKTGRRSRQEEGHTEGKRKLGEGCWGPWSRETKPNLAGAGHPPGGQDI